MREQDIAVPPTAALMTGKRATEANPRRAVELYRRILKSLNEPARIDYRGKPGVETDR